MSIPTRIFSVLHPLMTKVSRLFSSLKSTHADVGVSWRVPQKIIEVPMKLKKAIKTNSPFCCIRGGVRMRCLSSTYVNRNHLRQRLEIGNYLK